MNHNEQILNIPTIEAVAGTIEYINELVTE
jgi:hypothetical protein